jgi:hypothetical protein
LRQSRKGAGTAENCAGKGQSSQEWAQQNPDLENIRNDPRFKEVVGKKE